MGIKTTELTGVALDWAVAKANGASELYLYDFAKGEHRDVSHSTKWALGGPIIEREELMLNRVDGFDDIWACDDYAGNVSSGYIFGPTPLIAAMRCYVASKLGDEIQIPEELL